MPGADTPTPPYIGYCVECDAKHEVEGTEKCMCGGEIVPESMHPRLDSVQTVTDPDTGERLYHYEWNGWLWCEREEEAFDWETGDVTCPHCGEEIHIPPPRPRRFELVREEDVSGTSGTGVVATGVAYPDGAVHMQWRNAENDDLDTDSNGCAFKPAPDGVEATKEIHGHDGRTELRWID